MKLGNFTGIVPNFIGGFSGFSSIGPSSILWQLGTYRTAGSLQTTSETQPTGLWFKPDGTKLIVVGGTQDCLKSWDLTTAWDISTATNFTNMTNQLRNTTGGLLTLPTGVAFSNDGTKCFVIDSTDNALYRYTLSTAWDISTLNGVNADQVNTTIYATNTGPQSIWVKPDGLTFLTSNSVTNSTQRTFTTAVANDITTLTLAKTVNTSNTPVGSFLADDGQKLIWLTQANDLIQVGFLTTPYDITTFGATNNSRTMTTQDTTPQDIYVKNDGTAFYYLGSATDTIFQFTL